MIYNFNNTFVYWQEVDNHKRYKDYVFSQIFEDKENFKIKKDNFFRFENLTNDVYISNENVVFDKIIEEVIYPSLNNLIKDLNLNNTTINEVFDIWCNFYEPGNYAGVHDHMRSDISGVYILHNEEPNTTVFYNFSNCMLLNTRKDARDIGEGNILLWPGHVLHESRPCTKHRVTIPFDIRCSGSFEDNVTNTFISSPLVDNLTK